MNHFKILKLKKSVKKIGKNYLRLEQTSRDLRFKEVVKKVMT